MTLTEGDQGRFDNISAIWMLASYDQDSIITYAGITHRIKIPVDKARRLVQSRPELFSTVIAEGWLRDWKEWVVEHGPPYH